MAKHKGRELEVFLDGYAQGWKDGQGVAHAAQRLRYTDAPGVAYRPGGPVTGTELQMADMERVKRRDLSSIRLRRI